jgi:hypothetical protein
MRRWTARLATLIASVLFVLVPAGAANASFFCNSEKVPAPQMPGTVSSFLDPGPPQHTSPAWSTDGTGGFVYERYGYPPSLSTFDTGCANLDPGPGWDAAQGNMATGVATTLVALSNATHRFSSDAGWLGHFDALLQSVSEKVSNATYLPFVTVVLIALGIFLIWEARKKRLAPVVQHVAWALLVMTFAATVISYPLLASQTVDSVTGATIGRINSQMVGENPNDADPAAARESLVVDHVLYQNWLRANFGDNLSLADKDGPKLLDSLTYSRDEAAQIKHDSSTEGAIDDGKKVEFQEVAKDAEDAGGSAAKHGQAYLLLQGKAGNHLSAGILAVIAAFCVLLFLVTADLLVVISLLAVRLVAMALPAIAVPGVTPWGRPMVKRLGSLVGGSAFNAIVFSFATALDVLVVTAILGPDSLLGDWWGLVLSLLVGGILWKMLKPHRQIAATFGKQATKEGRHARRMARQALVSTGTGVVVAEVIEHHEDDERRADPRPETFTRPPRDPSPTLSDRPAHISPEDPAMRYRFPHTPADRAASAVPMPDANGDYVYPHTAAEDLRTRSVPNALVSRETSEGEDTRLAWWQPGWRMPSGPTADIYIPPAREPATVSPESPSYARIDVSLITRPKPREESE